MTINSESVLKYIEDEFVNWLSSPVRINTPQLVSKHDEELEINPLPDTQIWFKMHNWSKEDTAIQWGVDVPQNQDYLPENKNADEFIQEIQEIITDIINKSHPDKLSDDALYLEPLQSEDSTKLSIYSTAIPVDFEKIGELLNSMKLTKISSEFGSTSIYLDSKNPEESLEVLFRYNNTDEVYDSIFSKSLDEELNIHVD